MKRRENPFSLKKVCANCPFRKDRPFYLSPVRVLHIGTALLYGEKFTCHKTIEYGEDDQGNPTYEGEAQQFCAGALATLIRGGHPNGYVQVAERLGIRDPSEFDADSQPVYDSIDEWARNMIEAATATRPGSHLP